MAMLRRDLSQDDTIGQIVNHCADAWVFLVPIAFGRGSGHVGGHSTPE
jgi:hypothetical protein